MLCGKSTERVVRFGFDGLSTFGLFNKWKHDDVMRLLRALIASGFVDFPPGDFPTPVLTTLGARAMRSEDVIRMRVPRPKGASKKQVKQGSRRSRGTPRWGSVLPGSAPPTRRSSRRFACTARRWPAKRAFPAYVVAHDDTAGRDRRAPACDQSRFGNDPRHGAAVSPRRRPAAANRSGPFGHERGRAHQRTAGRERRTGPRRDDADQRRDAHARPGRPGARRLHECGRPGKSLTAGPRPHGRSPFNETNANARSALRSLGAFAGNPAFLSLLLFAVTVGTFFPAIHHDFHRVRRSGLHSEKRPPCGPA